MEIRFSTILPVAGLVLFTVVSIRSAKLNEHDADHPRKYFWWSSLRLDSDPLNRHPSPAQPCGDKRQDCAGDESSSRKVVPDWLDRTLAISGFPAFLAGTAVVALGSKQGVDEVLTFMVSMPILLFGWYFLVGRLVDWLLTPRSRPPDVPLKLT
jgi:hypothetical protein